MDFWGTVLVLVRRWYVALPAFLAALGAAFYSYSTIPITYTTSAVLVLTAPTSGGIQLPDPDQPIPRVNPLLNFDHGLDVAASILISVMSTPDMVADMGVTSDGPTTYAVTNGTQNLESLATGPLVFVQGESQTPQEATRIARKAIERVKKELDVRQRQVQAPAGTYITISEAVPPTTPVPQQGKKLRSAASALGLGLIGALTAAFAAESLAKPLRRGLGRLRRRDETPAEEPELVSAARKGA
ncbi:unnamed protein product [[Actinomadura] parvosata subsp. kistnae]|uniref:Polysaccharide chain length determinant N-terminal domain-containing protein n=1 Tax=[Actinomadura] parvosata subsp. kistnae TaxID=1909395 RepID=A0A1V0AAQ5_9ACTN|nr:hypothetical protein [Nonomuraea sp. ATCC 55076]AQZ67288.1 hypothetical protein BKM31_42740 [Nonomuraea sp. ATCC 55076]SPL94490.1 unnamed protein product [Actinomadura parvosata subsp. kistnae]